MLNYTKLDEIRFWSNVNVGGQKNGCWLWKKSRHKFGYGWFRINRKTYLAHRLSLIFYYGEDNPNLQANHNCDNPMCCNPFHLEWGTQKENIKHCIKEKRKTDPPIFRGEDHPQAKLSWNKVRDIRFKISSGEKPTNLAKEYSVCDNTIYRIKNNQYWKETI